MAAPARLLEDRDAADARPSVQPGGRRGGVARVGARDNATLQTLNRSNQVGDARRRSRRRRDECDAADQLADNQVGDVGAAAGRRSTCDAADLNLEYNQVGDVGGVARVGAREECDAAGAHPSGSTRWAPRGRRRPRRRSRRMRRCDANSHNQVGDAGAASLRRRSRRMRRRRRSTGATR